MATELATRYELTAMQAEFVRHVSLGLEPSQAVTLSGYSSAKVHARAHDLLHAPHVLAAIHTEIRNKLVAGAPIALAVIERLIKDDTTPPKIRLDAAKTLLDRAGHIAPRAILDKGTHELSLHEMSIADLRQLADRLEGEIAGRAEDIGGADAALTEAEADEAATAAPSTLA